MDFQPGQTLSHYRLIEKIGEGGMGVVWQARDEKLRRDVALKLLPPDLLVDAERRHRFLREARTAAAVNHPNIATVYEIDEADGVTFIAMELVQGKTLRTLIQGRPLPIPDALHIAIGIAKGLLHAHRARIVHRDLKPENVIVGLDQRVKILDFGLAKMFQEEEGAHSSLSQAETVTEQKTREGIVLGTVAYMSPEQAQGLALDSRSDVFSFDIVLYEMVAGSRPFRGKTTQSTLAKIMEADPEPIRDSRADVPPELERIVQRCLRKRPEDRYNDTRDLVVTLNLLQETTAEALPKAPVRESRETGKVSHLRPSAARWTGVLSGVVLLALLITWLVSRLWWPPPTPPHSPSYSQLTFTGIAVGSAISPDGQYFAYCLETNNGAQEIMVRDLSGGEPLKIFASEGRSRYLRWSPDGSELLVQGIRDGDWKTFSVPRFGGSPRVFPPFDFAAWSPDGTRFAGARLGPEKKIWLVEKSTGAVSHIPLTGSFDRVRGVDWSPRGDLLLVQARVPTTQSTLWTITLDGGSPRQLMEGAWYGVWSPDGDAIYYLVLAEGPAALWKVEIDPRTGEKRSNPSQVLSGLQTQNRFSISGDARRLLFTQEVEHANLWSVEPEDEGETRNVRTTQLTSGTMAMRDPKVSPDGHLLAFSRGLAETSDIFVLSLDDGSLRQLTFLDSDNRDPVWSPDGKTLAFVSIQDGRIWAIAAQGGTPEPFENASTIGVLAWAPGPRILFRPDRNYHSLDPESGEESPFAADDSVGLILTPRYSPDGTRVAVYWDRGDSSGVWILSLEDGAKTRVTGEKFFPIRWSSGGEWIYADDRENDRIVRIPAFGGEAVAIFESHFGGHVIGMDVAPDGKRFFFSVLESQQDIWLVENFDPEVS